MLTEVLAAAISDPTVMPLWCVLLFAASMYPVGFLLGTGCSQCCGCGCPLGEDLPDAVKVTFSGLTNSAEFERDLIALTITSCFGQDATAHVTQAGSGPTSPGAVVSVAVDNPGSGYAVLGRVEPADLSVYGLIGSGGQFEVVFSATTDECGRPAWTISAVNVNDPGSGYMDYELLYVSLGQDEFEITPASLYYRTGDTVEVFAGGLFYKTSLEEPALVADIAVTVAQQLPSDGNGVEFSLSVDDDPVSPTFGQLLSIGVDEGGDGYLHEGYYVREDCCVTVWNDRTVLLERLSPTSCDYELNCCSKGSVYVRYNGANELPTVRLSGILGGCGVTFEATTTGPYRCDPLTFEAEDAFETGTVVVEPAVEGDTADDFPCPPCCVPFTAGQQSEAGALCTQEECVAAGFAWNDPCYCGPCVGCEREQELIVAISNAGCDAGDFPAACGPQSFTLTLNADNGWTDQTEDFQVDNGLVADASGAYASLGFTGEGSESSPCTVYIRAYPDDCGIRPAYCNTGQGVPLFGVVSRGVQVPSVGGCFVGGAQLDCPDDVCHATVTITVVDIG
jgi:hypothetical protein